MTGFVFLKKAEGMTSFFAASRLRRIFSMKKIGHTGTLDPLATGVLPVALGGATRFIELIESHDKAYRATFILGKTTDTLDITGTVTSEREVTVKKEDVENALDFFKGEIKQLPPMYSAIKKDGVRLYDLARQGIEIEREEREVTIYSLELADADEEKNEYTIDVSCSSGTYIRSLISDIGERLLCGAVMTSLERTSANGVEIKECRSLEELESLREEGALEQAVVPVWEFIKYPGVTVSENQATRFKNGGELFLDRVKGLAESTLYNVFSPEGDFLGVGEKDEDKGLLKVKRVYVE